VIAKKEVTGFQPRSVKTCGLEERFKGGIKRVGRWTEYKPCQQDDAEEVWVGYWSLEGRVIVMYVMEANWGRGGQDR